MECSLKRGLSSIFPEGTTPEVLFGLPIDTPFDTPSATSDTPSNPRPEPPRPDAALRKLPAIVLVENGVLLGSKMLLLINFKLMVTTPPCKSATGDRVDGRRG